MSSEFTKASERFASHMEFGDLRLALECAFRMENLAATESEKNAACEAFATVENERCTQRRHANGR